MCLCSTEQEALCIAQTRGNGCAWKKGLQAMESGGGVCFREVMTNPLMSSLMTWAEACTCT